MDQKLASRFTNPTGVGDTRPRSALLLESIDRYVERASFAIGKPGEGAQDAVVATANRRRPTCFKVPAERKPPIVGPLASPLRTAPAIRPSIATAKRCARDVRLSLNLRNDRAAQERRKGPQAEVGFFGEWGAQRPWLRHLRAVKVQCVTMLESGAIRLISIAILRKIEDEDARVAPGDRLEHLAMA